jgi:CRISPR-associated protein Cas2
VAMTVVVTRDVSPRFRGFLASCMLEIAPGVYTQPHMTAAVRERVWAVLSGWFSDLGGGSVVMTWPSRSAQGGQAVETLGTPPKVLVETDGFALLKTATTKEEKEMARRHAEPSAP